MSKNDWKADQIGLKVRLRDSPGRQGVTTGRTKSVGSFVMVEVDFGPSERQFKRYDLLELITDVQDPWDILRIGPFGASSDLQRILTFEKIKGDLTNVFYSMEASNTDFYAHQFKPVMRFIKSPVGRLLIADEVGLGKTIEATYIWKELQARQGARRLLIVCPAMLREKWRGDLRNRFNIAAEIVPAKALYDRLEEIAPRQTADAFVYITSMEGLRPPADYEDEKTQSTRAKLARLLDQNSATPGYALVDYVIIDEAHYLRNASTGNNRIGRLLREASHHLVLLTATPVQIGSDNLYQLLRLIDPEVFYNSLVFQEMLRANAHLVRAQRALWRHPPSMQEATSSLSAAEDSDYFKADAVLGRVKSQLTSANSPDARIELLRLLEMRSLLSQYMTRSRKREVLEERVERAPQTLLVTFSPGEKALYDHVTQRLRSQSVGTSGVSLFALIARQRQMASSIVGALESWEERGVLEELLWDDLGISASEMEGIQGDDSGAVRADGSDVAFGFNYSVAELEAQDAKYRALIELLRRELRRDSSEKFVVFAFFRGTLKYLKRRLSKDGIRVELLMGDMGDSKDDVIARFAQSGGASVLLSSEVGSEGIDLQFCRFVVNYDLPWNPMRVEQRIGRLDRLGQRASRIAIISLSVSNTIEDRILMRLYDRINVFRESIGDIEEILGGVTEKLIVELFDPSLSEAEREGRAAAAELAISNTRRQQEQLEEEAVNLIGFSDYILDNIKDSRARGRWLSAAELVTLVEDYFAHKYPGTRIEIAESDRVSARITLSEDARHDLSRFIDDSRPATRTRLHRSSRPTTCLFDPRRGGNAGPDVEFVEPSHPLIQWIRADYARDGAQLHQVSAMKLSTQVAAVPAGDYVFCAHRWSFTGLKSDQLLAFSALGVGDSIPLDGAQSESIVNLAARNGEVFPNAHNVLGDIEAVCEGARRCDEQLMSRFESRLRDFEAENTVRCEQQDTSARKFAERRVGELEARVARFKAEGNVGPIAMTEGLIRREQEQLAVKLDRVSKKRAVDPTFVPLAIGVIRVE